MRRRIIIAIVLTCSVFLFLIGYGIFFGSKNRGIKRDLPLIAHAAGGIRGNTYTSSRGALDANYAAGFRLFELDFSWTSDRELALIHDWEQSYEKYFGTRESLPTLEQFLTLPMKDNLTQLSLERLLTWLSTHPDARIVTDVKEDNITALQYIKERDPEFERHFIPQIYTLQEYALARALGYKDIILTLYRMDIERIANVARVLFFAATHDLYAVTMPIARAQRGSFASLIQWGGNTVYVHTVNGQDEYDALQQRGIGIYTDWITPTVASIVDPLQALSASTDRTDADHK